MRMMAAFSLGVGLLIPGLAVHRVAAQTDGVVVLSDTVTGNQEQPKVLYIVPWQPAVDEAAVPAGSMSSQRHHDVFAHLERSEHQRELRYLEQLTRTSEP